ncbi:hypothetical protein HMPREF1548_02849 [Clostridium sp. KLE 1755]|nr:hypothetical protein HMPREF1548_02849 [Clostridium sp. KLE 1755]
MPAVYRVCSRQNLYHPINYSDNIYFNIHIIKNLCIMEWKIQ